MPFYFIYMEEDAIRCNIPHLLPHSHIATPFKNSIRFEENITILCEEGYEWNRNTNFTYVCVAENAWIPNSMPACEGNHSLSISNVFDKR